MTFFSWLASHTALPLYRNAYALMLSSLLTGVLGIAYWAIAARLFPAADVGIGASLISTMMFVGSASQLNLRSAMYRFLPVAGSGGVRLVGITYLFIAATSALLATGMAIAGAMLNVLPTGIVPSVGAVAVFAAAAVTWSLFSFQDHVLTSMRLTLWLPIENVIFALVKIGFLLVMVQVHPFGVFLSWIVAAALAVATVTGALFSILRQRSRSLPASSLKPAAVARFAAADYLAGIFSTAGTALLPVLVLLQVGPVQSAYFYVVWLITTMLGLAPIAMFTSLMVEVASREASFEREGRPVFRRALGLLLIPIAVLVIGAPLPLAIFGPEYAAAGASPLRLLAASVIPFTVNSFAAFYARSRGRMRLVILIEAGIATPSLLLSTVLLPAVGLTGVGIAVLFSQSLVAVGLGTTLLRGLLFGIGARKGA